MLVVVTLVASMAVQYVTTGAATAQTGDLCDLRDGAQFSDVGERDYGAAYILCMRALGLSVGKDNGEYGPDDLLTRAQAASFLVRLWRDVLGRGVSRGRPPVPGREFLVDACRRHRMPVRARDDRGRRPHHL